MGGGGNNSQSDQIFGVHTARLPLPMYLELIIHFLLIRRIVFVEFLSMRAPSACCAGADLAVESVHFR